MTTRTCLPPYWSPIARRGLTFTATISVAGGLLRCAEALPASATIWCRRVPAPPKKEVSIWKSASSQKRYGPWPATQCLSRLLISWKMSSIHSNSFIINRCSRISNMFLFYCCCLLLSFFLLVYLSLVTCWVVAQFELVSF